MTVAAVKTGISLYDGDAAWMGGGDGRAGIRNGDQDRDLGENQRTGLAEYWCVRSADSGRGTRKEDRLV
jgi:hypothetical protein